MNEPRRIEVQRPSRDELAQTIEQAGSLKAAALALGVSRMTLWRWTRDLGIEVRKTAKVA